MQGWRPKNTGLQLKWIFAGPFNSKCGKCKKNGFGLLASRNTCQTFYHSLHACTHPPFCFAGTPGQKNMKACYQSKYINNCTLKITCFCFGGKKSLLGKVATWRLAFMKLVQTSKCPCRHSGRQQPSPFALTLLTSKSLSVQICLASLFYSNALNLSPI